MRSRIVEEVVRRGPAELAGKARALVPRGGNLAVQLLEVGYPPSAILDGCSAATGVKQAAPGWLREPSPPPVDYDDGLLFRAASSAPVAIDGDTLCVAYGDPEAAADSTNHGLPPHRPYLAMPAQLSRALALLPVEPTLAEALPTEPTRRAAWAQKSQDPPRSLADLEQRRIDRALDGADDDEEPEVEATRTVPGGAPPMAPSDPGAADPGDADAMTVATSLAEMRRVAQLSKPGPRSGPASQEGGGFEDVRTQQVDLVSPADRAAVEATVTRTEASAQAQPAAPEARKQQKLIVAEDDYEDVATVALSQGALRAMIAPQHFPHNVGHEPKSPDVEENPFDDPTEHVGVLASLEGIAAARTAPRKPAALLTEPTPPPAVAPTRSAAASKPASTPKLVAPTKPLVPSKWVAPSKPNAAAASALPRTMVDPSARAPPRASDLELGSTQPMPRHQPTTESEIIPVPVARRGPSPMVSALSAVGPEVQEEPSSKVRSSERGARRIPGFDDAEPVPQSSKHIPGFDDAEPAPSSAPLPARKGRTVLLHPPDDHVIARESLADQQETEAEEPAPRPELLDPSALEPLPLDPSALSPADEDAAPEPTSPLDLMGDRDDDFSRPPLLSSMPSPPRAPVAAPAPRYDPRATQRSPQPDELELRSPSRRGAGAGGLQVLRAGGAPQPPPGLELLDEQPRAPAPPPMIPGIDTPLSPFAGGEVRVEEGGDGRSKQILIAASVIAVLIIVGAGVVRVRSARISNVIELPAVPTPPTIPLPSVPLSPGPVALPAGVRLPAPASSPVPAPGTASPVRVPGTDAPVQATDASIRQRELVDEARRQADPALSIALYSQAIELDPQSTAARDALFERAKLHLSNGDREHARADVVKLKRRSDSKELEHDLQLILDGAGPAGGAR